MNKLIAKSFTRQHDQSDCGVACLASIVKFYGGETSLVNLRRHSGTSNQGTTLLGLMQAARQVGFDACGLEAEGVTNLKEIDGPAILHVLIENRLRHYIVYYPMPTNRLILGDPAKGIVKMTAQE